MIKKFLMMLTAAVLLVACQNDEKEAANPSAEGMGTIKFQVTNYEQISFDDVTRAGSISSLNYLAMGIYDADTKALVSSEQKHKDDNGYGGFSATLPYGDYIIVFLGYTGSRQATWSRPRTSTLPTTTCPTCTTRPST